MTPGKWLKYRWRLKVYLTTFAFLLPALFCFTYFSWRPIIMGFWLAFLDFPINPQLPARFVGLQNFDILFHDPYYWRAWINTLLFVGLSLTIGYFTPLGLAILIQEMRRGVSYFRLAFYLPVILPMVVAAIMWSFIYYAHTGLLDSLLRLLGLPAAQWLQNQLLAMPSLVIMSTWKNAGGAMIIYLAALQGIPPQLYEASEIDGASIWQRLRFITIPSLLPIMLILFILQIIATFQVFLEPFIMTEGGPNFATYTLMMYIYNAAFIYHDIGVAIAASLMLFLVLLIITALYFIMLRKVRTPAK